MTLSFDTGSVLLVADKKVTLPVSKDNVIFGVRSVDTAGHRSLTVVPNPQLPNR